ncbi:hypothetical protein GCM10025768_01260 [Microbacterium pseudoresistens]|uniref:Uncharacterized protein n=1 Tax=Microbacterium pseudoresistens TaxID=640634 RepID=A0A7Y9JMF1_9MICO|nr:hypothetical protein [Microbacterium pseudoresistens]NYD53961.1 hypothetical protein [Microbacterium pseudoresistens]
MRAAGAEGAGALRRDRRAQGVSDDSGALPSAAPVETAGAGIASVDGPRGSTILIAAAIGAFLTITGCVLAVLSPPASGTQAAGPAPAGVRTILDDADCTMSPSPEEERAHAGCRSDDDRAAPETRTPTPAPPAGTDPSTPAPSAPSPSAPGERPTAPGPDPSGVPDPESPDPAAPDPIGAPDPVVVPPPAPAPDPVGVPDPPVVVFQPLAFTGLTEHHTITLLGIRILSGYTLSLSGHPGSTATVWYGGARAGSVTFSSAGTASLTLGGSLLDLGLGNPTIRAAYSDGTPGSEISQPRDSI